MHVTMCILALCYTYCVSPMEMPPENHLASTGTSTSTPPQGAGREGGLGILTQSASPKPESE